MGDSPITKIKWTESKGGLKSFTYHGDGLEYLEWFEARRGNGGYGQIRLTAPFGCAGISFHIEDLHEITEAFKELSSDEWLSNLKPWSPDK